MSELELLMTMFAGCLVATATGAVGAVLLLRTLGLTHLPERAAVRTAPTGAGYWETLVDSKVIPIDPLRLGERLSFERVMGWRPDSADRGGDGVVRLTMRRQVKVWVSV